MVINLAPPENFSGGNDVISMPCASDARASLAVSTCFVNLAVLWTVIFARATLDHLFYMCQNLLKNEAEHNRHYCDSIRCN